MTRPLTTVGTTSTSRVLRAREGGRRWLICSEELTIIRYLAKYRAMTTIRFYHSVICPRCFLVGRSLAALREDFPDVEIEEVEYLTNLGRAGRDGVRTIPALVADDRTLSGFYLTKRALRDFLESMAGSEHEQDLQGTG